MDRRQSRLTRDNRPEYARDIGTECALRACLQALVLDQMRRCSREVRNALAYVLNNWRRHEEDRAKHATAWKVDPYSNGWQFAGWKEREGEWLAYRTPPTYESLITWFPKTWLLSTGWRKHGLISIHEVPGPPKS